MQPTSSNLHFIRNQENRFEIAGVQDPRTLSNPFSKVILPEGINGYQGGLWNVIGWILENIFCKAVSFETDEGRVYLNKKSLVNYLGRVMAKPEFKMEGTPDWTENKWINKAVKHCAEVTNKMQKSNLAANSPNIPNETLPAGNNLPAVTQAPTIYTTNNQNIPLVEVPKVQKIDQETVDKIDDPRLLPSEIDAETVNQIKAFIDGKESRFDKDSFKEFITNLKPIELMEGYRSIDMIDILYTGYQGNDYKTGLLGYAVMQKNREVAELLFDLGASPNGNVTEITNPPIHFAVQNKDLDTALWLLEKRSVKAQSIHGYEFSEEINKLLVLKTPESIENLKKILSLFRDLEFVTVYNVNNEIVKDSLMGAAIVHDNLEVVKVLVSDFEMSIQSKYPYYSYDNYFKTPLERAKEIGRDNIVAFLKEKGAV